MSEKEQEKDVIEKKQHEKVVEEKPDDNAAEKRNEENGMDKKYENNSVAQNLGEEDEEVTVRPEQWMLRPCEWYEAEYKECSAVKARFNQYFIYGETLDCSQWNTDYANCNKWKRFDDDEAYKALVVSEKKHRLERLKPHFANDVWTRRDKPPENWNSPLPEWLQVQQKNTFLDYKQKSLESGTVNDIDMKLPFCTIM